MADKSLSSLTPRTTIDGSNDIFHVVDAENFVDYKATVDVVSTAIHASKGTDEGAEINSAANIGAGGGVYANKSGADLQFRSLIGGANVTVTQNADNLTIDSAAGGATTLDELTDVNAPAPADGQVLTWVDGAGEWQPSGSGGGGGEANRGQNLGTGSQVYSTMSGVNLTFRSLLSSTTALSVTQSADHLTMAITNATQSVAGLMPAADKVKVDNLSGTNTGDQNAAGVPFTPEGNVTSDNVQAAVVEVEGMLQIHHALTNNPHSTSVSNLTDTNVSALSPNEVLTWNGSTWTNQAQAGGGDVNGPASAFDDNIAAFDGTTGKLIKDGGTAINALATKAEAITENATHNEEADPVLYAIMNQDGYDQITPDDNTLYFIVG